MLFAQSVYGCYRLIILSILPVILHVISVFSLLMWSSMDLSDPSQVFARDVMQVTVSAEALFLFYCCFVRVEEAWMCLAYTRWFAMLSVVWICAAVCMLNASGIVSLVPSLAWVVGSCLFVPFYLTLLLFLFWQAHHNFSHQLLIVA